MSDSRLLEEIALAGPEHLDPAYVAGYDRKAQVDPAADLDELRSRGLGPASALIDFGAGTGTFAVAAAAICKRVVALDVSEAMVEATKAKLAASGMTNVDCVRAGFLTYEHEGEPVDFVYTRNALHHLPDFWKALALRRIADVLRPGGVLLLRDLVFSFEPGEAESRIADWIDATAVERPEDGWTRDELIAHVRDEHSTFSWLLEPMLERAGFEILITDYGTVGAYAAYVCAKRRAVLGEGEASLAPTRGR
jgi:SAM-dependent methyltransferase